MANDLNGRRLGLRKRLGLELFAQLYKHTVEEHPLRTLFWECTLRCNLNCRHCGSDCHKESSQPDMPLKDFLGVLENIKSHTDPNKVFVIITELLIKSKNPKN